MADVKLNPVNKSFGYKHAYFKDAKGNVTRFLLDEIDAHHNVRNHPKEWSFDPPEKGKPVIEAQTPQSAAVDGAEKALQEAGQKGDAALAAQP